MSPEKVAILVVAGLIAVLLAVALLGTESNGNGSAAPGAKAPAVKENSKTEPKQIESYTYEDIVRGTARPRPEVKPVADETRPATPTVEYVVRKADTFEKIARRELGSRDHVSRIIALNKGVNPAKLRIGQKILLPVVPRDTRVVAEAAKPKAKSATTTAPARRKFEPVAAKSGRD